MPTTKQPWQSAWVPDLNRFSLAAPPDWFLRALHEYDNRLFLVPSRQEPRYRLAWRSRRQPGAGLKGTKLTDFDHSPDTLMLYALRAFPVMSIEPYVTWNLDLIGIIKSRDVWAAGGADKAADALDEADRQREAKIDAQNDDRLDQAAHMAFKSKGYREGTRVSMRGKRSTPTGHKRARPVYSRPSPAPKPNLVLAHQYQSLASFGL